jgi:anti-sigma B factor antagonist
MEPTIHFILDEDADCFRIKLSGTLDERSFYTLSEALTDRKLDRPVRMDLQDIDYADSAGLRALVLLQRRAKEVGADFVLANPSPSVDRLFRVTNLWKIFRIECDSLQRPAETKNASEETALRDSPPLTDHPPLHDGEGA